MSSTELLLQVSNIKKVYNIGGVVTNALQGINININRGDFRLILGPSGCGKTTLLNIIGGITTPTEGKILIRDNIDLKDLASYSSRQLTKYRRYTVGIIFQFYNLIPLLSAVENVELSARLAKIKEPHKEAIKVLKLVKLDDKMKNYPAELSGGEQQRVAIARVLVKKPLIILADEPTGNLDSEQSTKIYELLAKISQDYNTTVLVVTHDTTIAESYGENHIHIIDGKLVAD